MLIEVRRAAALALVLLAPLAAQAYPAPAPDPSMPKSEVPVAVQQLRRAMLDPDTNSLTFHSMEQLFTTRSVGHSGPVWAIPRVDHALDFSYEYQGQRYAPGQFLDRTFTNALLVIKDGRIVYENYRNNTRADTRFIAWSMTKSITSILVGCALQEGRIRSLDDAASDYLPELKGGGYEGVSIRHILQMRSGVDYEERYDFDNPGIAARNFEYALVQNVILGPWIHVGSRVRNFALARVGDELTVRSRILSNLESKGHDIVEFDAMVVANGRTVVAEIIHTAIWRPRHVKAAA